MREVAACAGQRQRGGQIEVGKDEVLNHRIVPERGCQFGNPLVRGVWLCLQRLHFGAGKKMMFEGSWKLGSGHATQYGCARCRWCDVEARRFPEVARSAGWRE